MQPKTVTAIRRALNARPQPTDAELLRDAERLFLSLLQGDDWQFSWSDVRDWLRAYQQQQQQGYRRSHSETSDVVGANSPDGRYQS